MSRKALFRIYATIAALTFGIGLCFASGAEESSASPSSGDKGYVEASKPRFIQRGKASWYGGKFQGRKTASGEIFDTTELTAAHKRLPFGTRVKVTNLSNSKTTVVRINDRGPFVEGRIIDLSRAAARQIGMLGHGVAEVRISVLDSEKKPEKIGDIEVSTPEDEKVRPAETSLPLPSPPKQNSGKRGTGKENTADKDGTKDGTKSSALMDSIYTYPDPISYTIQIASFAHKENAESLYRSLIEAELDPSYEKSPQGHYRVVLKDIKPKRLEEIKSRLAELGHTSVLVKEKL